MVRRGLVGSRAEAVRRIAEGQVLVGGAVADKPSRLVAASEPVLLSGPPPRFVSRGGDKLDAALDAFAVDVTARRVLDAGASTGGFTDCLLQRGAAMVVAVDVGHGQLHPRIRHDARVHVIERFHIRDVTTDVLGGPVSLVVADLSFISLGAVISPLLAVCQPSDTHRAEAVLLVKPQFEAGREEVSRGRGVITDAAIHQRVRDEVGAAIEATGATVLGWTDSPITGGDGNREFLVHALVDRPGCPT